MHARTMNSRPGAAPCPRNHARRTPLLKHIIEQAIGVVFEIDARQLRSGTRGRADAAFARQVAMYLAHVSCGLTFTDTGRMFERDRTTVAHACGLIEDRREDARVDRRLDLLDAVIGRLGRLALIAPARLH